MPNRSKPPQNLTVAPPAATERQLSYIASLSHGRELTDEHREWLTTKLADGNTKAFASKLIGRLKDLPQSVKPAETVNSIVSPRVPAGHYALPAPDDDQLNPIRFYVVQDGTGKWDGRQFVNRYASDETHPVKGVEMHRVLTAIAADPLAAAQLYGHEIKRCSVCNRKLTRHLSRLMGMGAKCAGLSDLVTPDMIAAATADLIAQGIDPQGTVNEEN